MWILARELYCERNSALVPQTRALSYGEVAKERPVYKSSNFIINPHSVSKGKHRAFQGPGVARSKGPPRSHRPSNKLQIQT
jgi:hypothetical protein